MKSTPLWLGVAVCGLVMAGLEWVGAPAREALRFERAGVEAGEVWRLVTGHLVHLGWGHLALNLAGLGLMGVLFGREFSGRQWAVIWGLSMLSIDAGLYFFAPEVPWYVGVSGVLHGVMAAGVVAWWRRGDPRGWVAAVLLLGKLVWDQWVGPVTGAALGGDVIVDAHLYGALGGALAARMFRLSREGGDGAGRDSVRGNDFRGTA